MVGHLFQFFLNPIKADGNILRGDAYDGCYLVVWHALEPQKHDGAVEGFEAVDTVV